MATTVIMPRLSDTMKEGMIAKWLKAEGDPVEKGEAIVAIQSDKATLEVEAYESGVLRRIVVREEEVVPLGEAIAIIAGPDDDLSGLETAAEPAASAPPPAPKPEAAPAAEAPPSTGRIKASPLARKMAAQMGVDLASVQGRGPGGRITKRDILGASEAPPAPASTPATAVAPVPRTPVQVTREDEAVSLSPMRKIIAQRLTESKTTVPHFYITIEVDMGATLALRAQINEQCQDRVKVTINDLVLKAAGMALAKFPRVNSSFDGERVIRRGRVNVGIAVAMDDGLVVPVIRDCDQKALAEIGAEARDLVERGRQGKLTEEEYTGGTFTVSNMGMLNVENFAAIINPPEAALLAVASVRKVPVIEADAVVPGDRMKMTLSGDHRVMNGQVACEFLDEIRRLLENPLNLVV